MHRCDVLKTCLAAAVQDHSDDLPLLYLRQVQLCQAFAGIEVVLATHQDNENTSSNICVHSLLPGELDKSALSILVLGFLGSIIQSIDKGIAAPCCTDKPPFAPALRGMQIF